MINANQAQGLAMVAIRKEKADILKLFEGFLEYADKVITEKATAGWKQTTITCNEFKPECKKFYVPDEIIASMTSLGFQVARSSDLEDGYGIVVKWLGA